MKIKIVGVIVIICVTLGVIMLPFLYSKTPVIPEVTDELSIKESGLTPALEFNQIIIKNTGVITVTDLEHSTTFTGNVLIDTSGGTTRIEIDPMPPKTIDDVNKPAVTIQRSDD